MKHIFINLRIYLKFLSRNKLYSFVSVLGFAISIAFVMLIASHIHQELSMDNFHSKSDRIKTIVFDDGGVGFPNMVANYIKDQYDEVEACTRINSTAKHSLRRSATVEPYEISVMYAEGNFFDFFDFTVLEGDPHLLDIRSTVLLSEALAHKEFAGENPIGKTLNIGEVDYQIIGIFKDFPQNTQFKQADCILSYPSLNNYRNDDILNSWNNGVYQMFFLEKEGMDFTSKQEIIHARLMQDYFAYKRGWMKGFYIIPFKDLYFHYEATGNIQYDHRSTKTNNLNTISIYLAIVILILVIASLNYINMTVAQSGMRAKELALRQVLGASRTNIITQNLLETIGMIFITLLIAILFAVLMKPYFETALNAKLYLDTYLSIGYIFLAIACTIVFGFLVGLMPALINARYKPIEIVQGEFKRKLKGTYSNYFICIQFIICITLIIISTFILLQSNYLRSYNIGVDKDRTMIISTACSAHQRTALRSLLMQIPGVEVVSFTAGNPIDGGNNNTDEIDGKDIGFQIFTVDSAFTRIFDIPFRSTGMHQQDGVIMNKQGINALHVDTNTYVTRFAGLNINIAAIAEDFHFRPLTEPIGPAYIQKMPDERHPWALLIKISSSADLHQTAEQIRSVHTKFIGHSMYEIEFIDATINDWYEKENRLSKLITAFSIFSIVITVMGIFAMSLYLVKQKEKEIGVRKVNGATEWQILKLLNTNSIVLVLIAAVIAIPIAYYVVNKWLESFAYKISISPLIFLLGLAFVIVLTTLSVSLMAWRTARSNPIEILKSE